MSKLKKLLGLVLAGAMTIGMAVMPAVADTTDYTITITNNDTNDKHSHTYEAYQVFTGDVVNTTDLENIKWGSGVNSSNLTTALANSTDTLLQGKFTATMSAEEIASVLATNSTTNGFAEAFAQVVGANLSTTVAGRSTETASPYTVKVTGTGYYFIKDKDGTQDDQTSAYTDYILKVTTNVQATAKETVPTLVKKVAQTTDATTVASSSDWHDAADYNGGDKIAYKLTGTLPNNYASYDTYEYAFHDTLNSDGSTTMGGLALPEDFSVVVKLLHNGTESDVAATNYVLETASTTSPKALKTGETFAVYFSNLKNVTADSSDKIIVYYYATLDKDNAVVGTGKGNPNTSYLTFSNNANQDGTGKTGKTPNDTVTVFTFQIKATKVKPDGNSYSALSGVTFELKSGTTTLGEGTSDSNGAIAFKDSDGKELKLKEGTYTIHEKSTPAGYTAVDDFTVTIASTYTGRTKDADAPTLSVVTTSLGNGTSTDVTITTASAVSTPANIQIVNHPTSNLPATGGIGTTIFYIVGAALIAGAAALLVVKKRRNA